MAIYTKQLRFLLGSSLQETSEPPCGAFDRFRKFGLGRLAIKGHLHDDVILLLRPKPFRVLLSCANEGFCYSNLAGITKFEYERENERILVVVVKWRHRANGLLGNVGVLPPVSCRQLGKGKYCIQNNFHCQSLIVVLQVYGDMCYKHNIRGCKWGYPILS